VVFSSSDTKPGDRINPICSSKRSKHGKEHLSYECIKEKHYTEKLMSTNENCVI
jgi:hypothetical protein